MPTPFRTLESVNSYAADGVTTLWNFSFSSGYLDQAHVKAYQLSPTNIRTELSIVPANFVGQYQLSITPPVPLGYELTIYRDTPTDAPLVDFTDRAAFTEVALDTVVKQAVFSASETRDALSVASERIDTISSLVDTASSAAATATAKAAAAATSASNAATSEGNAAGSAAQAAASAASILPANLIHTTGNESMSGTKTFTGPVVLSGSVSGAGFTPTAIGLGNVNNTADSSKPVSTAQAAAIALVTSFRNKVRNAFMDIAQRGAGAFVASGNAGVALYTMDGWIAYNSATSSQFNVSQATDVAATADYQNCLKATVATAKVTLVSSDLCTITQPIEGYLIRDLSGNPTALRFDVRSSKTGTYCVTIRNGTGGACYIMPYTITTANVWQTVQLSIPAGLNLGFGTGWNTTNGVGVLLTFVLAAGTQYQTASANTWVSGNMHATAAQVNWMDTANATFSISAVQLERGSASTILEHRDIACEWLFNYRYYVTMLYGFIGNTSVTGVTVGQWYKFPTLMRVAPTISVGTPSENANGGTPAIAPIDSNGFRVYTNNQGASGSCYYTNNLAASAEL